MVDLILQGLLESIYMTVVSTLLAYILGLPMGVLLVVTDKDGINPMPRFNAVLGFFINVVRSIPFLILLVALLGFTKFIVGTIIGPTATLVPLTISAAPFIARLVESSIKEVDGGVIEAAQSMGASTWQIITKVMISEAKPALIVGSAVATITVLGYSAMAGFVGGGGLGDIAIRYGYYKFDEKTMWLIVLIIVVFVQILQEIGMKLAKFTDNRIS